MSLLATQIAEDLAALVETVTTANGYVSNVGANVRIGQTGGTRDDAPAAVITPGTMQQDTGYSFEPCRREMRVTAFADLDDHPTLAAHALIDVITWDLRRAIEDAATDAALYGHIDSIRFDRAEPGFPDPGGSIVGAALVYTVSFHLSLDDTDTAI